MTPELVFSKDDVVVEFDTDIEQAVVSVNSDIEVDTSGLADFVHSQEESQIRHDSISDQITRYNNAIDELREKQATASDYEKIKLEEEINKLTAQIIELGGKLRKAGKKKKYGSQKARTTAANVILYIVLSIMCVVWILPFIFILLESFRTESTGLAGYIWPKQWGFDNYIRLFKETEFPRWFGNTLLMGIVTAIVQTVFILAMSYALSRHRFKGRNFLMKFMLVLGMFPGFLTLILLYTLLSDWGLAGSNAPYGLIIIYTASSGMGYYICKGFFDTVSHSLDEAARVDGATRFQIFYKIIIPLSKPIIIYTILMGFMAPWGDFVMASFMSNNAPEGFNVAAGLQWLLGETRSDMYYTTFCAGGVVVALPITLLFMFLQRYYVAGVTGGAVKG